MRPRQPDHEEPITADDAPALCPSCRKECYADADTGEVSLTRLYFAMEDGADASSQIGSSPVRPPARSNKQVDRELMGLAKRAKEIGAEFSGYDCEVDALSASTSLRRAETLIEDAASAKAILAVKVGLMPVDQRARLPR